MSGFNFPLKYPTTPILSPRQPMIPEMKASDMREREPIPINSGEYTKNTGADVGDDG